LVTHAAEVFKSEFVDDAIIEILDLNDYEMPIYSIDRENANGIPAVAHQFFEKITACDALLISYAEHNGNYPAAYKNIFDWASRIEGKVFQGKPIVAMSASVGPGGGGSVLKLAIESAPFFGAEIKAHFSVGPFDAKFDKDKGELSDAEAATELRRGLALLVPS